MIQELLGGGNATFLSSPSPSPSPSPSSSATTTTKGATPESPRCPRCDSANTKFCYYNNYNLTQPRHFCKTCRRYWTKGGALRNVPIGGGCRKAKNTPITTSLGKASSATKFKSSTSQDMITKPAGFFSNYDQMELSQNPILWATPHNSHLLSLLRSNPNPNSTTHFQNHESMKEESLLFGTSNFLSSNGRTTNDRAMSFENLGPVQIPSVELSNSFYRNQGIMVGEVNNHGLHELYQRLRSTTNIIGSTASTSASSFLESAAPVAANHDFGLWNPSLSWSTDLTTSTHGAFP